MKTQEASFHQNLHAPPHAEKNSSIYSTCRHRFFTSRSVFRHTRHHVGLVVCHLMESDNLALPHTLPRFLSCHHALVHSLTLQLLAENPCWCHLTSLMMSSPHVSSHTSMSISALLYVIIWRQQICSSICDLTQKPGTDLDSVTRWLTLTRWLLANRWLWPFGLDFCVDFWPKVKIFERANLA